MNFPTRHPLYGVGDIAKADVILCLEVEDIYMLTHRVSSAQPHRYGRT